MKVECFVVNMIQENCYLLTDTSGEAAIIDCGAFYTEEKNKIRDYLRENNLQLTHLFNTHAHFDHIWGAQFIYNEYNVKIELSVEEKDTYEIAEEQMKQFIHRDFPIALPPVGHWFSDGEVLTFGNTSLQVIATPGHTPGGVCFYNEKAGILFSGDSFFHHSIGRCDLPGGNSELLVDSLCKRILTLPDTVQVFPGHGEPTTIGEERHFNPYL